MAIIIIWLAFVIGWIANLWQVVAALVSSSWAEITPFLVLKIVAIFLGPVGSVLGYIGMF